MLVGVVGSDKKSRSKPPARIFMSVSFSGVMSFRVVLVSIDSVAIVVRRNTRGRVQVRMKG